MTDLRRCPPEQDAPYAACSPTPATTSRCRPRSSPASTTCSPRSSPTRRRPRRPTGADRAVTDLGARRRRIAGIGLLAAAAVVVAGVGDRPGRLHRSGRRRRQQRPRPTPLATRRPRRASAAAPRPPSGRLERRRRRRRRRDGARVADEQARGPRTPLAGRLSLPTPTSSDAPAATSDPEAGARRRAGSTDAADAVCVPGIGPAAGVSSPRHVRRPARLSLVFAGRRATTQRSTLFVCGDAEPVRTLTLPAP